jgi:protein-L-isoaspartate(D-aspartate) O-methyltransferase
VRRGGAARLAALGLFLTVVLAAVAARAGDDGWTKLRRTMVDEQIRGRGITAPGVLSAMGQVPRHMFVPLSEQGRSYADQPLPFDAGRTIYQPYVVALMTSLLDLDGSKRVLEIGTGSGYHAAVLSRVVGEVYTIEIVPGLADRARRTLARLGYGNVHVRTGDGFRGWPERAPFDAILLTAAPRRVPAPLLAQLKPGGRLVAPVGPPGEDGQQLEVLTKRADGSMETRRVLPVRFVPMTGEAESRR